jgi:polyisoprenoid-binding protein YceI
VYPLKEDTAMSTTETVQQIVPTGTWKVDPVHSSLEFAIRHMGLATIKGRFADLDATIEGGEEPRLTGTIRTASIATYDQERDTHLRSPEFFDVERYPEARLESVRFEPGRVAAELTLKGVTREVEFDAEVVGPAADPFGNERIGLELEGAIDRTDFGVSWNAPLPDGGQLLDNTVKLSASLSLIKEA